MGLCRAQIFSFDKDRNVYVCPNGKLLHTTGTIYDGKRFAIVPPSLIAIYVRSKCSAARTPPHGRFLTIFTKTPAMLPAH